MAFKKTAAAGFAAAVAFGLGLGASLAADDLQGTWQVKDSKGQPFQITLSPGGKATGTERPEMNGTWQQEGSGAVIHWNTGWTTKIEKNGSSYTHTAWRPGQPPSGQAASSSEAQKMN